VPDPSAERVARNNDIFRRANEQIRAAADAHEFGAPLPFLCECTDERCTEVVPLTREEYSEIRGNPRRFVHAVGHTGSDEEHTEVVDRSNGHEVVEKVGEAGELAEELDRERA
jgi:hypothetical protein